MVKCNISVWHSHAYKELGSANCLWINSCSLFRNFARSCEPTEGHDYNGES